MKQTRCFIRIETDVKNHFVRAAKHDRRSLSEFLIQAGLFYSEHLRSTSGWRVKDAPKTRDGRRKAVAA
jgi:hypothetical protein